MNNKFQATVIKQSVDTPDIVTISFTVDGKPLAHVAGQYITVYFDDTDVKQGKAYSISSSPHDSHNSITVKKIGLFSGKLHDLKVGDTFTISTPYGFFNAKSEKPVIAIAAGVGIAPIWSIIRHEYSKAEIHSPITLLYSNKTRNHITFLSEIEELSDQEETFSPQHFITREMDDIFTSRRISVEKDVPHDKLDYNFYICGSVEFVGTMWRQLVAVGVNERSISTETFFETK